MAAACLQLYLPLIPRSPLIFQNQSDDSNVVQPYRCSSHLRRRQQCVARLRGWPPHSSQVTVPLSPLILLLLLSVWSFCTLSWAPCSFCSAVNSSPPLSQSVTKRTGSRCPLRWARERLFKIKRFCYGYRVAPCLQSAGHHKHRPNLINPSPKQLESSRAMLFLVLLLLLFVPQSLQQQLERGFVEAVQIPPLWLTHFLGPLLLGIQL